MKRIASMVSDMSSLSGLQRSEVDNIISKGRVRELKSEGIFLNLQLTIMWRWNTDSHF